MLCPSFLSRLIPFVTVCRIMLLLFAVDMAHAEEAASLSGSNVGQEPAYEDTVAQWEFGGDFPGWETVESGLELGKFPFVQGENSHEMIVLRANPEMYRFEVHTASCDGKKYSLEQWAQRYELVAVINASMYLPDGITSTGYLRVGDILNNGRVVRKFGAFFVTGLLPADGVQKASLNARSEPLSDIDLVGNALSFSEKKSVLPETDLLDRTVDDWKNLLPRYSAVVQNYRMIGSDRRLLWNPGGPRHSIAALGKDGEGHILFFLCQQPITGVEFGSLLLQLPIDIRVVMYAEGGSQAGLYLNSETLNELWMGRYQGTFGVTGNRTAPLPNVIGIRRR